MASTNLLRKVGGRLAELLSEPDTLAQGDHDTGSNLHDQAAAVVSREDFERHLRSFVKAHTGTGLAGRVNFIGLSKIREQLGARWPDVAERADEVTRRAIQRRLTSADVYTRYQELHYLILFAQLSKEQAQLKCALIAEEITKRLLGDEIAPELLEVKTVVSRLDQDLRFEDVPSVERLAEALSEAQAQSAAAKGQSGGAEGLHDDDGDDQWWNEAEDPTADPLAGVQVAYRPMWHVRRKAVTTYVGVPVRLTEGGRVQCGESKLIRGSDASVIRRLDLMLQRRVISHLRKMVAAKQKMLLCLPVHFETLATLSGRTEYLDICRRGVPNAGIQLLVFELTGVPEGVPQSRLFELSGALRQFGRGIIMQTSPDYGRFKPPSDTGVSAVGFEVEPTRTEARTMQEMERYAAAAKKAGLATYVRGLPTLSLTTAAIAAGLDFVDGDVVSSVVDHPRHAYAYDVERLFGA